MSLVPARRSRAGASDSDGGVGDGVSIDISLSELGEYSPHILKSHKSIPVAAPSKMGKRSRSANSQGEMRLLQGFKLSC